MAAAILKIPDVHYFWHNPYSKCVIGFPKDTDLINRYFGGRMAGAPVWEKPVTTQGGHWLFVPPRGLWSDPIGLGILLTKYEEKLFVRCEDEDEFKLVTAKDDSIEAVRDGNGKLRGFYGAMKILENVTERHAELMNDHAARILGAEEFNKEREEKARQFDETSKKLKTAEEELAVMRRTLEEFRKVQDAARSKGRG